MSLHLLQRAPRNADLGTLHLTFFVTAIATELGIRTQLYLTHYPQLGGHGLHIAHLLWGGVFMVGALAILLSLLGRRARQVAALLADVAPTHPLREQLVALAEGIDTTPNPDPPWFRRFADVVAARYRAWSEQPWFHRVVIVVFAGWALAGALLVLGLVLSVTFQDNAARPGFEQDSVAHLNFLNVASLGSTAVSCVLVAIGMERLWRGDRLEAYAWFTRALLVSIFITRVFTFVESQFGAAFGLAIDVAMLISIQLMTAQERRRHPARPAPHRPADESAAPAPG